MKIIHWIADAAVAIVAFFLLMILTACGGGGSETPTATDMLVVCQANVNCKG